MNDDELASIAEGIILHLREKCTQPIDALFIILCTALLYYKTTTKRTSPEEFAENFSRELIKLFKANENSETMQ